MDRVSPEIAEEVRMLFEDLHPAASASAQQARHHACRTTSDYDQIEVAILLC
jgi:hypothetical protein